MTQWWNSLPGFERNFWYFAIPFTLVFVIRLIATLSGFSDSDEDMDSFDGDDFGEGTNFLEDFRLFTLHNFIIFFTGFGWAGIFALRRNFGQFLSVLFASVVGILLMLTVAAIFYFLNKLDVSGNTNINNAVNSNGRVYIPIPAHKSGSGQIQITIQGSLREVHAVTEGKALPTGTSIKVISVVDHDTLLVEKNR
ncbi:MAG: hypothetical protein NUK65_08450 [Firmicutes bacterium]|nr:hypothetical protein [Bacillota bacterium]